jgi:hypothetical protein
MLTWPQMKLAAVLMPTKAAAPMVELDTLGTFYVLPEACHSHRHSTPTKELSPAGNVVHGDWTSAKRIPSGFRRCRRILACGETRYGRGWAWPGVFRGSHVPNTSHSSSLLCRVCLNVPHNLKPLCQYSMQRGGVDIDQPISLLPVELRP